MDTYTHQRAGVRELLAHVFVRVRACTRVGGRMQTTRSRLVLHLLVVYFQSPRSLLAPVLLVLHLDARTPSLHPQREHGGRCRLAP
jgi:hypothetical protein